MGLLDKIAGFLDALVYGGKEPVYEYEERKWARQERALRKMPGVRERPKAIARKVKKPRTEAQRKKHRQYMVEWRKQRPGEGS